MSGAGLRPLFLEFAIFGAMVCSSTTLLGAEKTVTVSEDGSSFTLDNGIVTAQVAKRSGDLVSLKYRRLELPEAGSGHPFGYWSHDASRGERTTRITIDPKTNGGAFGEVSVKSRS